MNKDKYIKIKEAVKEGCLEALYEIKSMKRGASVTLIKSARTEHTNGLAKRGLISYSITGISAAR